MKKNRMMRLASILLVCVLLTTSVISGTFAKYTSTATGSDTARVAKWSFTAGGTEISTTDEFTFDLWTFTDRNNVDDADTIIAPGTKGQFSIALVNNSEVTANYTVSFVESQGNVDDKHIPIQYSLTGADDEWKDDISQLNIGETTLNMKGGSNTVTVYWRWAFDDHTANIHDGQTDVKDTALGIEAQNAGNEPLVVVTATITATQVD